MFQQTRPLVPTRGRFQVGRRRAAMVITALGLIAVPLTVTRAHASPAATAASVVTNSGCIKTGSTVGALSPLHDRHVAKECIHLKQSGHFVYSVRASYQWWPSFSARCGVQVVYWWHHGVDTVLKVGRYTCIFGDNGDHSTDFSIGRSIPYGMICTHFSADLNPAQRACIWFQPK